MIEGNLRNFFFQGLNIGRNETHLLLDVVRALDVEGYEQPADGQAIHLGALKRIPRRKRERAGQSHEAQRAFGADLAGIDDLRAGKRRFG
ncbi:MAG: hypothetical protein RR739_02065, partial [Clostridia bacterium]